MNASFLIGKLQRSLLTVSVGLLSLQPSTARACALCMGGADSKTGPALNGAIFLMLGFIGSVLALIILSAITLTRRARQAAPPHAEFHDPILESPSL